MVPFNFRKLMIIPSFSVEKISNGRISSRIYHNRSVYLLEPIYLSLNCGVILISKTERGGFPVITEGLDVRSRASTQVVSSETQQPSKNSTLTSVSGQSNSLMSNMFEWEKH